MRKRMSLGVITMVSLLYGLAPQAVAVDPDPSWVAEPTTANVDVVETLAAPPWGACGIGTDEGKEVRTFAGTERRVWVLRCGGPKYSSTPSWGYRHILWRHKGDFERMAAGTNQNWRDVADLALDHIAKDPDAWGSAGDGKDCRSRLIYLVNKNTGQVVRTQIVTQISVYRGGKSSDIITAYPSSKQCS